MAVTDYRAMAYELAGPGNERRVDAIAADLHYNESIHMHNLGREKSQHGKCEYCWLRAGRAVRALTRTDLLTVPEQTVPKPAGPVRPGQTWASKGRNDQGRQVRIEEIDGTHARVVVTREADQPYTSGSTLGRRSSVAYDHRGLRGYRLVDTAPEA